MPQKKNPSTAELIRSKAGTTIGTVGAILSTLKAVPMSNAYDLTTDPSKHINEAFTNASGSFHVIQEVVAEATFDKETMESTASRGFTTATELADTIVRETDIAFRTAHHIIGRIARDYDSDEVTAGVIDRVAREITGEPLNIDQTAVEQALDPRRNVKTRDSLGGPGELDTALADAREELETQREVLKSRQEALSEAESALEEAIEGL